ncbi:aromatic prenyltransferase [Coprinopsis marcescibilis]|uniref:Aromatic prenyltransferase n=1 Tax=Coprinopsis marcescibilis TaxID=230819 RepID=A0A5C3KMB9_COPMA|nr:aromatic prenyltransferase [Coprinopsis marcescibilis]
MYTPPSPVCLDQRNSGPSWVSLHGAITSLHAASFKCIKEIWTNSATNAFEEPLERPPHSTNSLNYPVPMHRPDLHEPLSQDLATTVRATAIALLGRDAVLDTPKTLCQVRGLKVYDLLTRILPFSAHSNFWWIRLGAPFAAMLDTANYDAVPQCKFLCFVYRTVIALMPPHDTPCSDSVMTIDNSPVELSWVLPPQSRDGFEASSSNQCPNGSAAKGVSKQSNNRQVRFAIEPMHPVSGRRLKGSRVLDYLTSAEGSLGLIAAAKDSMTWRKKTEQFLFPQSCDGDEIPDGSRFFVGFDFLTDGTVTLKVYYLPAPHSPTEHDSSEKRSPIALWDVDYKPLRRLVSTLDPALLKPLDFLLSYFDTLDEDHKPRIQIISMDCVTSSENRLKIYCRPKTGSSWSDAVGAFTLGGRLHTPQMEETVRDMERLWNNMFPQAHSSINCDLHMVAPLEDHEILDVDSSNGIQLDQRLHPVGGLLYYYSLFAGKGAKDSVYPKLYLPVSRYCSDDQAIARAIEDYYTEPKLRMKNTSGIAEPEDWVSKEIRNTFNHRQLSERTGIHTYVTFALKKRGSELTNYFSPEPYLY